MAGFNQPLAGVHANPTLSPTLGRLCALQDKMMAYQDGMRTMVLDKASKLEQQGWSEYKA